MDGAVPSAAPGRLEKPLRRFTLHGHCGALIGDVRACLKLQGVRHGDPLSLSDDDWDRASGCRAKWDEFRRCGADLMDALDNQVTSRKHHRCADILKAAHKCHEDMGPLRAPAACEALDYAALRCLGKDLVMHMSERKASGCLPEADTVLR